MGIRTGGRASITCHAPSPGRSTAQLVFRRLEAYYYAFGSNDFVIIIDLSSNVDAAALSLAVNASGAVASRATVLITPEEVDQATKKTVKYHPPGK